MIEPKVVTLDGLLNQLENHPKIKESKKPERYLSSFAKGKESKIENLYLNLLLKDEKYAQLVCNFSELFSDSIPQDWVRQKGEWQTMRDYYYNGGCNDTTVFTCLATESLKFLRGRKKKELLDFWNNLYNFSAGDGSAGSVAFNLIPIAYQLFVRYPEFREDVFYSSFLERKSGWWFSQKNYARAMKNGFLEMSQLKKEWEFNRLEVCSPPSADVIYRAALIGFTEGDAAVAFLSHAPEILKMGEEFYFSFFRALHEDVLRNKGKVGIVDNEIRFMAREIKKRFEYNEPSSLILPVIRNWRYAATPLDKWAISHATHHLERQYGQKASKLSSYRLHQDSYLPEGNLLTWLSIKALYKKPISLLATTLDIKRRTGKREGTLKASALSDSMTLIEFVRQLGNQEKEKLLANRGKLYELFGEEDLGCIEEKGKRKRFLELYASDDFSGLRNQLAETKDQLSNSQILRLLSDIKELLVKKVGLSERFGEQLSRLKSTLSSDYDFDEIRVEYNSCFLDDIVNRVVDCVSNDGSYREFGLAYCLDPQVGLLSLNTYLEGRYQSTIGKAILMAVQSDNELYLDGITASPDVDMLDCGKREIFLMFMEGLLQTARKKEMRDIYVNLNHYDGLNSAFSHEFNKFIAEELIGMAEGEDFTYTKESYGKAHVKMFKLGDIKRYKNFEKTYEGMLGDVAHAFLEKKNSEPGGYSGLHFLEGFSMEENKEFLPVLPNGRKANRSINLGIGSVLAFRMDVPATYYWLEELKKQSK